MSGLILPGHPLFDLTLATAIPLAGGKRQRAAMLRWPLWQNSAAVYCGPSHPMTWWIIWKVGSMTSAARKLGRRSYNHEWILVQHGANLP